MRYNIKMDNRVKIKNKDKIISRKDRTDTIAVYIFIIFVGLFLIMGIYFFS